MTDQSAPRPVPGPHRSQASAVRPPAAGQPAAPEAVPAEGPFAHLQELPVGEHVAVFEAEHARLQDELSTIDRL